MSRRTADASEIKVYIGDLPREANEGEISRAFEQFGRVKNVWVARNPPGFGFVFYENYRDAQDACKELDGKILCGVRVRVEMSNGRTRAKPWVRQSGGPPFSGGMGGGGSNGSMSYSSSSRSMGMSGGGPGGFAMGPPNGGRDDGWSRGGGGSYGAPPAWRSNYDDRYRGGSGGGRREGSRDRGRRNWRSRSNSRDRRGRSRDREERRRRRRSPS